MGRIASWFWRLKLHTGRGLQWLEQRGLRGFRPSTVACVSFTYLFRDVCDYRDAVTAYYAERRHELRFLSVGCATGQEPFSIALFCQQAGIPCSVTGVDLSPHAIAVAQTGILDLDRERKTAQGDIAEDPSSTARDALSLLDACAKYFQPIEPGNSRAKLIEEVRSRVTFRQMDICDMDFQEEFDFVVCRKMLYYLPAANREIAIAKMRTALKCDAPLSNIIFDGYTKKQPFFAEIGLAPEAKAAPTDAGP